MKTVGGLTILWVALSSSAFAFCDEPQPRLVCAEYFNSKIVVEAKLVHSRYIDPTNEMDGHVYEMQTEKVLRGQIGERFNIWEENSSGRATFGWKPGRSYLLFLISEADRGWYLDGCGNSGPLNHAAAVLTQIRGIHAARGGMIRVVIGGKNFTYAIEGADVRASNSMGSFSANTNKEAVAEIHVPPGKYKISVSSKEAVTPSDITYEDPQNVVIEAGGCAQVQFVQK